VADEQDDQAHDMVGDLIPDVSLRFGEAGFARVPRT
jgi:hypothetical protein